MPILSPRYCANQRRSCASIWPRRGAVTGTVAGISAALRAPLPAPRRAVRDRVLHLVELDLAGLRVDPADVLMPEVGEPGVVFGVGNDVVDVVRLALGRVLERLPGLDLPRGEVEAVH